LDAGFKACPYCAEPIREAATICRYCNRSVGSEAAPGPQSSGGASGLKAEPILKPSASRRRDRLPIVAVVSFGFLIALGFVLARRKGRPSSIPNAGHPSSEEPSQTPVTIASATPPDAPSAPVPPPELSTGEIFTQSSPSVVLIEVFDDEGHKRGLGSGFLVSAGGSVLTNYHVIRGAYSAVAHFQDETTASVLGVVGYDHDRDVAVIAVASTNGRQPLKLGSAGQLNVGDKLVAIGSPEGLQNTTSEGIVSALRGGVIQMSTPISPGSSGGPVLNNHGEVVGIAVAVVRGAENLNFAVPIEWAAPYVGGSPSKSLTEVAQENTVSENVLDGPMAIPARGNRAWTITLDRNRMSNPALDGQFQSTGGADGLIRLAVACNPGGLLYDSRRVTYAQVHVDLPSEGACQLMIDNSASLMFGRTVTGTIALRYVK
jgi:S1-C subfamily serine protease